MIDATDAAWTSVEARADDATARDAFPRTGRPPEGSAKVLVSLRPNLIDRAPSRSRLRGCAEATRAAHVCPLAEEILAGPGIDAA